MVVALIIITQLKNKTQWYVPTISTQVSYHKIALLYCCYVQAPGFFISWEIQETTVSLDFTINLVILCVCVCVFRCVELEERRDYISWRVAEDGGKKTIKKIY